MLQNWYHSLLSDEDVLLMWSTLVRARSEYEQWEQAQDIRDAMLNSIDYCPEKEREIYIETYFAFDVE